MDKLITEHIDMDLLILLDPNDDAPLLRLLAEMQYMDADKLAARYESDSSSLSGKMRIVYHFLPKIIKLEQENRLLRAKVAALEAYTGHSLDDGTLEIR